MNVSSSLEDNDASSFVGPSLQFLFLIEVLGGENVDLEMAIFLEDLEKVGKTFFQAGAKKSKIVDKISIRQEVLKRGRVKIVLVVK
jgi:hypothetical protein